MPALNANVTAYINRVITLIDHPTLGTDVDVECRLQEGMDATGVGDTVIYVNADAAIRLTTGNCTIYNVAAGTSEALVITRVDAERGRVHLNATAAADYSKGDRLFQTYTNTGRRPQAAQADTVPTKDMANCLQLLTDACDQTVLTATGGTATTVVNAGTLGNAETGLTALIGATVTMVTFAAGTPGETSTVVACPNANTLTVAPAFSAAVAGGDTYTVAMDQIDSQINVMLNMLPSGTVSPDAPAKNPASFWYTFAAAIVRFQDQLASGMATPVVYTDAQIESIRGLLRTYPTLQVARAATAADVLLYVSDISMMYPGGGTAVLARGTLAEETVAYTRPRRIDQPGRIPEGAGPINMGDRMYGGTGVVSIVAGLANNQAQGASVELRTATIGGVATAIHPGAPAPPDTDTLKHVLGTLLTQLRTTVTTYVIPT